MRNKRMLLPVLLSSALVFNFVLTGSMLNGVPVMAQGQATLVVAADTTVPVGNYLPAESDVGEWTDIIQVAAAGGNTVGLKSDGTVVAVGDNEYEQCNVGNWTDIIQVVAGLHTVGLRSDGTVVAVGYNYSGECAVGGWANITQVAAGGGYTVGLKSDGTVVSVGSNVFGQRNIGNWTDIVQVAAGANTLGLKSDGTVVAAGGYVSCCLPSYGCFIATAAYGSPMAGEIEILRRFRDEYLLTNPVGQAMADLYYRVSPPIAEFITEHPSLKPVVRATLLPAVLMSTVAVKTTSAEKIVMISLLALVLLGMAVWAKRWRSKGSARSRG
jgi:alpha-tubulin suppressor-like RCC1 family protein